MPYATMAAVAEEVSGGPVDATEVAIDGTVVINDAGEWVGPESAVSWADIEGIPADFADGVDDAPDAMAELGLSCLDGDVPVWDGTLTEWACGFDQDTLADMDCADGQLVRWNGATLGWFCDDDIDTVLSPDEVDAIVADNGYAMATDLFGGSFADLSGVPDGLDDGDDDTLAGIACVDGEVLLYSLASGGWACGIDSDSTLTSAEVQAMVESMAALALGAGTTIGGEAPLLESSTVEWTQLGGVPDSLADGDNDAFAELSCADGEFLTVEGGAWSCEPFDGDGDGVPVWTDCDDGDTSLGSRITDSDCDAEDDADGESGGTVMYGNYRINNSVDLANLAGYTEVTGELEIQAGAIPNIDALTSLTTVGGDFFIQENNAITNLDGLENLTSVGGRFEIKTNASLTDTSGLRNLASIGSLQISGNAALIEISGFERVSTVEGGFVIIGNRSLTTVGGFESLTEIGGRLYLYDSPEITNIDAFSELTTVGDNMNIEEVHSLTNLDAFSSLTSVSDYLRIYRNNSLTDISGLSGVSAPSRSNLNIRYNSSLCQSLVDDLVDTIGSWFATGVGTGSNNSGC